MIIQLGDKKIKQGTRIERNQQYLNVLSMKNQQNQWISKRLNTRYIS